MKIIVVTGGVLSGIGKGVTASSIGAILKAGGYQIFMQKFDGYLNIDPGNMDPLEHGEVFVTEDGAETDLDIGHYERFIDTNLNKNSSWTTGKLYQEVFERERKGVYHGGTVQVVSHVASLVKEKIKDGFASSNADISIVEIGGTVGDMENEYLIESVRQLKQELGSDNVVFVHLVYLPFLGASKELKTKPAQNSVRDLRSKGIEPDVLVVRSDLEIPESLLQKMSLMCGISSKCVIPSCTVKSIYQVPFNYYQYGIGSTLLQKLQLPLQEFDMSEWVNLSQHIEAAKEVKHLAIVGKYGVLEDAYYSLNEALKCVGYWKGIQLRLSFIDADVIESEGVDVLQEFDGICIPGGGGKEGNEGLILAAQYAREKSVPFLGIGLGLQIMMIEFARNVLGCKDANSEEFGESSEHFVVLASQSGVYKQGVQMRIGAYAGKIVSGTIGEAIYGSTDFSERHHNAYECNNAFRNKYEDSGLRVVATSANEELIEMVAVEKHPFMVGILGHPEYKSRPLSPHPLIFRFIEKIG